ncbi:uncharacterized protein G6M90_00g009720 [Metarhizium brunneum]|uniref:Uncharacterized protein n=1 Tax=Metarhizium brunneum TaxID=500148 RepID=A0A7D5UPM9_9HYPO|nr:hypothetical protein G6M90_00g009720 [Metarhizium brunneum]
MLWFLFTISGQPSVRPEDSYSKAAAYGERRCVKLFNRPQCLATFDALQTLNFEEEGATPVGPINTILKALVSVKATFTVGSLKLQKRILFSASQG